MEKTFDDILTAALDELDRGVPVETILAAHPQHADELSAVLATLTAVQRTGQDVRPGHTLLHNVLGRIPAKRRERTAMFSLSYGLRWLSLAVPIAVIALVLLGRIDRGAKTPTPPIAVVPSTNVPSEPAPVNVNVAPPLVTNSVPATPPPTVPPPASTETEAEANTPATNAPATTNDVAATIASITSLQTSLDDAVASYTADALDLTSFDASTDLDALDADLATITAS